MNVESGASLASFYAPEQSRSLLWLEVVVITAISLGLAHLLLPTDPLLLSQGFPWLWLAPLLLALRYGSLAGVGSALLMLLAWFYSYDRALESPTGFPRVFFLGGMIMTLGAGQFADIWSGRLRRVREINHYLDERLDGLTRRHYLLMYDHRRLEQDLLLKPLTLRHTLSSLRELNVGDDEERRQPLPAAQALLGILAQCCQLEVASLHSEWQGSISALAVASLGEPQPLENRDPMYLLMLERNQLCHVQTDAMEHAVSQYLVCVPILTTQGQRLGVLLVERMPFLALNEETLQLLQVTLGYYADVVTQPPALRRLRQRLPDCPLGFASELLRLDRVYRASQVDSTLVALSIDASLPQQERLFNDLLEQRRSLDTVWPRRNGERQTLLTLMPLHGQVAAQGYVQRLDQHCQQHFGLSASRNPAITLVLAPVGRRPAEELLQQVLEQCHAA